MRGTCHCGAVTITLAAKPAYLNDCNCSLCSKLGAVWGYLETAQVSIAGDTGSYTRADRESPAVRAHFCTICGCTTHWSPMPHIAQDRMGVNMRLFPDETIKGLTLNFPDGAAWNGKSDYAMWKPAIIVG